MTKFLNTCAVVLAITGLSARDSAAQGDPSPGDNTGIKSQNAYLSYMPWESINPYGGSVVLQFVDFVLPGNAGMDVRWQRTFNSNVTGGWRFGLTGFPMRIEDPGVGQGTPVFFTIDGAARTTKPVNENDANVVFSVTEAWQYDRTTHLLLLPNGWRVEYGIDNGPQHSARFPTRVYDLFQNELTLTYESPAILYTMPIMRLVGVHQTGPHGVDRQVTIHYDGHDRVSSVEALGRTWTYHYDPSSDPFATWYMSVLSKVDLPDGTSWEYSTANIPKTVTTPLGGQVSYTFEVRQIGEAERFVLTARDTGGRNVNAASGHWAFDYESRGDGSISATTITSPSNVVKYTFNGPFSEPLEATPTAIEVRDLANNVVETESFTYGNVHQDTPPDAENVLVEHSISRDGRTCHEEYGFSPGDYADYHNPSQIHQWGCGAERWITREYKNSFHEGLYKKVALTGVSVAVAGSTIATEQYDYNLDHGLITHSNINGIAHTYVPSMQGGNVEAEYDALGHPTSYDYDKGVVSGIHPPIADLEITREINEDGTVHKEFRRHGNAAVATTYGYTDGRLTSIEPPLGNTTNIEYLTWGGQGDARIVTTTGGYSTTSWVNGFGQTYGTRDSFNVRTTTAFDADGRVVAQTYPYLENVDFGADDFTYDALGRLKSRTHSDGKAITFGYGADGQSGTVVIADENGHATTQIWESFGSPDDGRLAHVRDDDNFTWDYSYDAAGKLIDVAGPDGSHRTWSYNGHANPNYNGTSCFRKHTLSRARRPFCTAMTAP